MLNAHSMFEKKLVLGEKKGCQRQTASDYPADGIASRRSYGKARRQKEIVPKMKGGMNATLDTTI